MLVRTLWQLGAKMNTSDYIKLKLIKKIKHTLIKYKSNNISVACSPIISSQEWKVKIYYELKPKSSFCSNSIFLL